MRNITVSLDDDLVRRAKVRAAMEDSSVSAVVRRFLEEYARGLRQEPGIKSLLLQEGPSIEDLTPNSIKPV